MAKKTKSDIHKKAMIEALQKTLGIVSTACKAVNVSRDTHYRWYREDEEYKKAVNDVDNIVLDFAESKLHKQIDDGNTTATIFFLKTKGKGRGYVEKNEIEIITDEIDLSGISEEDLKKFIDNQGAE
jgi:hypothetical protein